MDHKWNSMWDFTKYLMFVKYWCAYISHLFLSSWKMFYYLGKDTSGTFASASKEQHVKPKSSSPVETCYWGVGDTGEHI